MQTTAALKTGDQVTARSLEEAGARPRRLSGTLTILRTVANPPYPAFIAYFVDGQEANIATIHKAEPDAITAANSCHSPDTGQFCETPGAEKWNEALKTASDTPEGSAGGKYWLTKEGKYIPVRAQHSEYVPKGQTYQDFVDSVGAIRVTGLSAPDVDLDIRGKISEDQMTSIINHLGRGKNVYVVATTPKQELVRDLRKPSPEELETTLKQANELYGSKTIQRPKSAEFLKAITEEFYNESHDELGRFAEKGTSQFKPGTTEATIVALLESTMKGGAYGRGAKTLDEAKQFVDELRTAAGKSDTTTAKMYLDAIDKVAPVFFKEKDKAAQVEAEYRKAVEDPSTPTQLFNPKYAAEVKARQTELAENQIVTKAFVETHPEYQLSPGGHEGTDYGWLQHSATGEDLSRGELAYQARKWIKENEAKAEAIIARSDVYVRIEPPSLTGLLNDGRIRTFHEEQGQENSISNHEGGNSPETRRHIEEAYFGKGSYPVYGYLSDDPHGFLDLASSHPLASVEGSLGFYGDIAIKLKPEVRDRTTYTLGDSSALFGDQPVVVPQPLQHPSSLAGAHFADLHNSDTIREAALNNFGKVSYFESQIHGGVRTKDIQEIVFTYTPPQQIQDSLARQHISWRALEKDPEQGYSAEEYGLTAAATEPLPLPLWKQRAISDFHAIHDQSTHGRRYGGATWGYSHSGSQDITGAAAEIIGEHGYYKSTDPPSRKYAESMLDYIAHGPALREALYSGHRLPEDQIASLKIGEHINLPLAAASGDRDTAEGFSDPSKEEASRGLQSVVYVMPPGTHAYGYSKNNVKQEEPDLADDPYFQHQWDEAIVSGRFQVQNIERDNEGRYIVHLTQDEVFDPRTGSWGEPERLPDHELYRAWLKEADVRKKQEQYEADIQKQIADSQRDHNAREAARKSALQTKIQVAGVTDPEQVKAFLEMADDLRRGGMSDEQIQKRLDSIAALRASGGYALHRFSNPCHAPDSGQFCETNTGTAGFPADDAIRDTRRVPEGWTKAGTEFRNTLREFPEGTNGMNSWRGDPGGFYEMSRIARGEELTEGGYDRYPGEEEHLKEIHRLHVQTVTKKVNDLKAALLKAPQVAPYLAYRGIRLGNEATQQEVDEHLAREYPKGEIVSLSHPGNFQSASGKVGVAVGVSGDHTEHHEGVVFEIKAHTMANISYDNPRSTLNNWGYPAEHEVLFHPDTQFRVINTLKKVPFKSRGKTYYRTVIQVEEV